MNWLTPLLHLPPPRIPAGYSVVYIGKDNTGRRGTPVTYRGVTYDSLAQAARENGTTVATVRYRVLHNK